MHRFKRNQVEEAIVQTVAANIGHAGEIKLRLQRLLVTDRRLESRNRKKPKEHSRFAFYSQKAPGSGVEVMFSQYEAFALLIGLLMLQHGIPQATVVTILRRLRGDLEILLRESLEKHRKRLFDPQALKAMERPGLIPTDNADPAFLVSVERTGTTAERIVEVSDDEIAQAIRILYSATHSCAEGGGTAALAGSINDGERGSFRSSASCFL